MAYGMWCWNTLMGHMPVQIKQHKENKMDFKKILALLGVAALLLFSGCGQKYEPEPLPTHEEQVESNADALDDLPEWVVEPKAEGALAAVGMSGLSRHGLHVMIQEAELDGRGRLAAKIQLELSRLQEQSIRHSKLNNLDDIDTTFRSATKEVVEKIPLSGARRTKMYQDKQGNLYVLMVIEKKEVGQDLASMSDIYKEQLEQAKLTRQNIEEGMKVLDESIKNLESATD